MSGIFSIRSIRQALKPTIQEYKEEPFFIELNAFKSKKLQQPMKQFTQEGQDGQPDLWVSLLSQSLQI